MILQSLMSSTSAFLEADETVEEARETLDKADKKLDDADEKINRAEEMFEKVDEELSLIHTHVRIMEFVATVAFTLVVGSIYLYYRFDPTVAIDTVMVGFIVLSGLLSVVAGYNLLFDDKVSKIINKFVR